MRPLLLKQGFESLKSNQALSMQTWIQTSGAKASYVRSLAYDAVRLGKDQALSVLLQTGKIDINQAKKDGSSLLSEACRVKHTKILDVLLQFGADPSLYPKPWNDKYRVLSLAMNKDWTGWKTILNHPQVTAKILNEQEVLSTAVFLKNLPAVELILDKGASINQMFDESTVLSMGILTQAGIPILELLLDRGADPTLDNKGVELLSRHPTLLSRWEQGRFNASLPQAQSQSTAKPKFL